MVDLTLSICTKAAYTTTRDDESDSTSAHDQGEKFGGSGNGWLEQTVGICVMRV